MEEMSYKRLRELQRQEKEGAALVALPREFYSSLCEFLNQKRGAMDGAGDLERREYDNMIRIIREINSLRKQKIVFRAVRTGSRHETEGMTAEEHALYDRFCGLLSEDAQWFEKVCEGKVAGAAAHGESTGIGEGNGGNGAMIKKVRLLKDVQAYRGLDNATYGPFKPGDEASLPAVEADFLVKSRFASAL